MPKNIKHQQEIEKVESYFVQHIVIQERINLEVSEIFQSDTLIVDEDTQESKSKAKTLD